MEDSRPETGLGVDLGAPMHGWASAIDTEWAGDGLDQRHGPAIHHHSGDMPGDGVAQYRWQLEGDRQPPRGRRGYQPVHDRRGGVGLVRGRDRRTRSYG